MKLQNGSLMFNMNISKGGGTPNWGTELGQGKEHKYNFENAEKFITALAYTCVDDMENVKCELGKGGSRFEDYRIEFAGLFKKVYVNGELIPDAEFMLIDVKQLRSDSGAHIGRHTLKYGINITYRDEKINEKCFNLIKRSLGLNEKSAWFVNEIETKNQDEIHLRVYVADKEKEMFFEDVNERKDFAKKMVEKDLVRITGGFNEIYYGVPGTGKSYEIDNKLKDLPKEDVVRTTFHPEYTYNDFVGQLLPTTIEKDGEQRIEYKFQIGPFTRAIKRAYNNPTRKVYLVIEEMSRGNCAAIFGDIFQLLDRDEEGKSKYFIDNDLMAYEISQKDEKDAIKYEDDELNNKKIRIPSNLFIYGTVNVSDQNVFVMDTAFKRRFDWKYRKIDPVLEKRGLYKNNVEIELIKKDGIIKTNWIELYQNLNTFISSKKYLGLGEDKQIGQFFIEFKQDDVEYVQEKILNKLLHYLWFDVNEASYTQEHSLFDNTEKNITSFSELYAKYESRKQQVFSEEFLELFDK